MKRLLSTFLCITFILCLCLNTTKVTQAVDTPTIYNVGFNSLRSYENTTQRMYVYTKSNSKVQYKIWLYSKENDSWKELTSSYTNPISAENPFAFTIPKLKFGSYTLSIWVKTAGQEPLNKKGYDSYYSYNFFCSHYDGQVYSRSLDTTKTQQSSVPSIEKIVSQVPFLYAGNSQIFQVLSKGFEQVQYRVWLNDKSKNTWEELTTGYTSPLQAQMVYSIATPNLNLGDYTLSIWIKRANKNALNVKGYDDYASFNFNCLENDNGITTVNFDKLKNNYELNENIGFTNSTSSNIKYKYNIFDVLNNKLITSEKEYKNDINCPLLTEGAYILQLDAQTFTKVKVDKGISVPDLETPGADLDTPMDSEYEISERVDVFNKLIVVGKPYKKSTGKVAYLTFDDGPSTNVTPRILATLDKYNIKATFFVTGINASTNSTILKQIYEKGHVIANHSYSHNYNLVYSSTSAFTAEIQKTNDIIKKSIPSYNTKIFRFPGGSYGRNDSFKTAVKNLNYTYYDWNALNGDAEGHSISKEKLLARTKETVSTQASVILLMHDAGAKSTTADALPAIIDYLISSGYEFKTLEEFNK